MIGTIIAGYYAYQYVQHKFSAKDCLPPKTAGNGIVGTCVMTHRENRLRIYAWAGFAVCLILYLFLSVLAGLMIHWQGGYTPVVWTLIVSAVLCFISMMASILAIRRNTHEH